MDHPLLCKLGMDLGARISSAGDMRRTGLENWTSSFPKGIASPSAWRLAALFTGE